MAAQFLRSVQLRLGVYFQTIDTMSAPEACLIPPPNLVELLTSIRVQSWVPPIMPQVPALPATVAPPAAPTLPPVAGPAVSPRASLPVPLVPAPPAAPAVSHERVTNPSVHPDIKAAMEGRQFQIRELFTDTVRPLVTSGGHTICCSYHMCGYCFFARNCHQANTHLPLSQQLLTTPSSASLFTAPTSSDLMLVAQQPAEV